jgi:hypothetical protein
VNRRTVNDVVVLFYKPTPKECADCHAGGGPKSKSALALPAAHLRDHLASIGG